MVLWKQRKSPHNSPLRMQNYQVSAFLIQKKGQFVCDLKYLPYLCTRKTERYLFATPFGALVQLVRIHACHAWGHGFESRTHRFISSNRWKALIHFGIKAFFISSLSYLLSLSSSPAFAFFCCQSVTIGCQNRLL